MSSSGSLNFTEIGMRIKYAIATHSRNNSNIILSKLFADKCKGTIVTIGLCLSKVQKLRLPEAKFVGA